MFHAALCIKEDNDSLCARCCISCQYSLFLSNLDSLVNHSEFYADYMPTTFSITVPVLHHYKIWYLVE